MRQDDEKSGRRDADAARLAESAAILRRVKQETDPQVGAHASRMMLDAQGHFGASDVDPRDRIEVWGTRIGRSLGLVAFAVLAVLLAFQLLH